MFFKFVSVFVLIAWTNAEDYKFESTSVRSAQDKDFDIEFAIRVGHPTGDIVVPMTGKNVHIKTVDITEDVNRPEAPSWLQNLRAGPRGVNIDMGFDRGLRINYPSSEMFHKKNIHIKTVDIFDDKDYDRDAGGKHSKPSEETDKTNKKLPYDLKSEIDRLEERLYHLKYSAEKNNKRWMEGISDLDHETIPTQSSNIVQAGKMYKVKIMGLFTPENEKEQSSYAGSEKSFNRGR